MSNINEKNVGPRWYVVHTWTGYENKVKVSIEKNVEKRAMQHLIYEVRVPVELHEETKENGEIKIKEVKVFPGYVFVFMTMTDESWHVIRAISGVTGFVGPGSEPEPLTDDEVKMFRVEEGNEESVFPYNIGDRLTVVSGTFASYSGVLQAISEDQQTLEILVSTGRRDFPVTVDTKDVKLADD